MEQNLTFNRACRRNVQIIVFCAWFGLTLYEKSFWHFESPGKEFRRELSVRLAEKYSTNATSEIVVRYLLSKFF